MNVNVYGLEIRKNTLTTPTQHCLKRDETTYIYFKANGFETMKFRSKKSVHSIQKILKTNQIQNFSF